jgi:hypothetical protein
MAIAASNISENAIELITADRGPHYEPFGWHHWPEHPWLAYQFRRGLGETQEGGGSVSEVMQAGSRMIPGDLESWHAEWMRIADRNWTRGLERFPLFVNRKDSQRAANKILWPSRAEEAGNGVFERFTSSSDSGC